MSVYSYEKDKDKKISEHFQVKEFKSHANGFLTTDVIIINDELIKALESLIKVLGATKCTITSGYRDSKCDKLVGGSGRGQHVEGNAADCIFYNKTKIIDPKLISCKAQDLGFGGIARINDRAIHLDVRTGRRYLGDETKGNNSVTTDFYKYYNIERNNKDIDKVCKKFGLDKDFWNKNYNNDLGKENIIHLFEKISEKLN